MQTSIANSSKRISVSKKISVALWILQGLLALFFAAGSGAPKLLLPADVLPMPIPLPSALILFIGTCEVLGGLGLILPGLMGVRPGLAPLAAAGLVLLTVCAAIYNLLARQLESAVFALGAGVLAGVVAYGRWCLVPHRRRGSAATRPAFVRSVS
jgi:uncharacterized membrane protein